MLYSWQPHRHSPEALKLTRKKRTPAAEPPSAAKAAPATPPDSIYAKVLDEAERLEFQNLAGIEGIDDEIALLRVKLQTLVRDDPENINLMMAITNMLTKMVKAKYAMNKKQEKSLGEAIKNVIRDIGVPLGVAVLNKKL
jgi:hypothetical protein